MNLILSLLVPVLFGQLSLSPSTPTIKAGAIQTFTATGGTPPYTYSLRSGSAGFIDSVTGIYTAPASVTVKHQAGGCMLLPPDHIFNTRVDALPVHADSTALLGMFSSALAFSPSFGPNYMTNSTGTFSGVFLYTPLNNDIFQILNWPFLKRESGYFSDPFATGDLFADRHVTSINKDTCQFSDIYNNYPSPPGNVAQSCPTCTAQSGVKYNGFDFILPTTGATDAAGMAQQPVALRLEDLRSGALQHALRFTLGNINIEPAYQWPATANATPYCSGSPCWKYGMYIRLKNSYNISGFSAPAQIILLGLKRYGLILTDGGTNMDVQTSTDMMLDPVARAAIKEITQTLINDSNFEVVDVSSLDISSDNGAVNLSNGYVTPTQYAEVVVTDAALTTATSRVALQGISVGTSYLALNILAGSTAQLDSWVTGNTTQTVTWAKVSGAGSVDSNGLYTAPSGITSPTEAVISATSTVDTNAIAYVKIMVFPDNDSGAIRIDIEAAADTTSSGHTYWKDSYAAFETGLISYSCCVNPGAAWPGGTPDFQKDASIYYSDTVFNFRLPNGNYKITASMARGDGTGVLPTGSHECHHESQSQLGARSVPVPNYLDPVNVEIPMWVTNGTGYYALRKKNDVVGADNRCLLSGLSIVPDATPAHISIDDGGDDADVTIGQTKQLYAVGWYMANTVTWSVISGPGSIDSDGLYTAPSTPPLITTSVTIRATSTVDSSTANYTFDFTFGTISVSCSSTDVSRGQSTICTAYIGGVTYSAVAWARSGSQGTISSTGVYTAPGSVTDATISITATSIAVPAENGSTNIDISQLIPSIYVNAGQTLDSYTDGLGIVWPADNFTWTASTQAYGDEAASISGVTDGREETYQYQRYRYQSEAFSFTSSPVPSGYYRVTLMFAEFRSTVQNTPMNIEVCGKRVATNFDPVALAGAVRTAYNTTVYSSCTAGNIVITFTGLTAMGSSYGAFISGIIIEDLGPMTKPVIGGIGARGGIKVQ